MAQQVTQCSNCTSTSSTWVEVRKPAIVVVECKHCDGKQTLGSMDWTLEAHATRTQFAPDHVLRYLAGHDQLEDMIK